MDRTTSALHGVVDKIKPPADPEKVALTQELVANLEAVLHLIRSRRERGQFTPGDWDACEERICELVARFHARWDAHHN